MICFFFLLQLEQGTGSILHRANERKLLFTFIVLRLNILSLAFLDLLHNVLRILSTIASPFATFISLFFRKPLKEIFQTSGLLYYHKYSHVFLSFYPLSCLLSLPSSFLTPLHSFISHLPSIPFSLSLLSPSFVFSFLPLPSSRLSSLPSPALPSFLLSSPLLLPSLVAPLLLLSLASLPLSPLLGKLPLPNIFRVNILFSDFASRVKSESSPKMCQQIWDPLQTPD